MRIALRIGLALLALLVLVLVGLAVALPRIARSDAVRSRIETAARDATGRELRYAELDFGLLPPSLVVREPALAGATPEAEPLFEAEGVALRVALAPLLARTVVVDSLVVEGATLRLRRTEEGIVLPAPAAEEGAPEEAPAEPEEAPAAEEAPEEEAGGVSLAVRELRLDRSRLVLEDRTVSPATTWELRDLEARARGRSLEEPLDVEASGTLASGGTLALSGTASLQGDFDLALELDAVALEPAAPYLAEGQRAAGRLTGTVQAQGADGAPERLRLDASLAEGAIEAEGLAMQGALAVKADVAGGLGAPEGTFEVDATEAELRYDGAFHKPRGTEATATGRIVTREGGRIGLEDTHVRIRNFEGKARLETGERIRARVDAPAFALDGWEALVPGLAEMRPRGRVALDGLEVATSPLEVRGRVDLDGLRVERADAPEAVLTGALLGEGRRLVSRDLRAVVGGETIALDATLSDLEGELRLETKARAEGAESNALLAALAGRPDTLYGPLDLQSDLSLPLAGSGALVESLEGRIHLAIVPGRLKGVSLLESVFDRLGSVGEAALLAGRLRGGRTLQRFYEDEFQRLEGTLDVGGGVARTDDLVLVYRDYRVDLRGSLGLSDLALDLRGTLTIGEEIDEVLAAESGGAAARGEKRVIPLAKVTGTLASPRVTVTREAALRFASSYAAREERDELREEIDERLGEGSGEQVLDALEGILGGRRGR